MNNTTQELNFNLSLFQENFSEFKLMFDNGSGHPENFYCEFYDEFISGDEDKLFTDEDKKEWIEEWNSSLDGELDGTDATFEEILEENEFLTEDLTGWIISSDEPKFAPLKEKFIAQLFFFISETESKESIKSMISELDSMKTPQELTENN